VLPLPPDLEPCFRTVRGGTRIGAVQVEHTSEADYFQDSLGHQWVRKVHIGWQELLAEMLGCLMGRALGVHQPPGALFLGDNNERGWLSGFIPHTVHWAAGQAHFVQNLDQFGAMLTLDALIHNHDRHAKNILLTSTGEEPDMLAWSIDTGAALVGFPSDFVNVGLAVPEKPNIARGLPVGLMEIGAYKAAHKATELAGSELLRHHVAESCRLVGEQESDLLFTALSRRMEQATRLAEDYMKVVGAIT
jgi:hypothetical protein